jgi:uncharacterized protein
MNGFTTQTTTTIITTIAIIVTEMKGDLTVVIKPTRDCNLRCKYCSVGDPESEYMTKEIAQSAIEKIVGRADKGFTKFIWHGGEPLLMGIYFYKHVLDVQRPLRKTGHDICNVAQTNGTLINKDWAEFFKENHFGVGLSIDGPGEINDATRVFKKNVGAFEAIQRGAKILDEHGVEYGYLTVISKHNVERIDEIIDFMKAQQKRFKLVAVAPIGRAADAQGDIMIDRDNYSDSQIRLLDRWLKSGNEFERSALWKYIVPVLTGSPIECMFQENCQDGFIGVDSNGDVYPCGRFCGGGEFLYGNIVTDSFESIWNHPTRIALTQRSANLLEGKCGACNYVSICNGGCPLQGYLNGGINKPDYNCRQYFKIFRAIESRIRQEVGTEEIREVGQGE